MNITTLTLIITLSWNISSDVDISHWDVWSCDTTTGTFRKINDEPLRQNHFTDRMDCQTTYFVVTATDTSGNVSEPPKLISMVFVDLDKEDLQPAIDKSTPQGTIFIINGRIKKPIRITKPVRIERTALWI